MISGPEIELDELFTGSSEGAAGYIMFVCVLHACVCTSVAFTVCVCVYEDEVYNVDNIKSHYITYTKGNYSH